MRPNKWLLVAAVLLSGTCQSHQQWISTDRPRVSPDSLLILVQHQTFKYFWDGAEPVSGMARERYHFEGDVPDDFNVVTTGGTGFGIMALLVGMERDFITRQQGFERIDHIADYLQQADRFHGAWPHWIYGETGKVKPFSETDDGGDIVETGFLVQGLLTARQYFMDGNVVEMALAAQIDTLWRQVEWDWFTNGSNSLHWHWSPNHGFSFPFGGFDETLIVYVLAAASPTHGISAQVYHTGWARDGAIVYDLEKYGHSITLRHNHAEETTGPLFWSHYSFLGLDPRELESPYANYWEHNTNHTLINRQYCIENPKGFSGYGEEVWGLTASYSLDFYAAHSPGLDVGVISPTAALSSFPYTPEYSMQALEHFYYELGNKIWGEFGFYDAFSIDHDWYPKKYLAIDQGPIVAMIENYRSALLWDLFMSAPEIQSGLTKLGFRSF
jgi:hypothetical protein